jgi:CheY-like chemotaxis protein
MASPGPAAPVPGDRDPAASTGELVLVVEDNPDCSKLAGKMLQSLGCRVEFAADGLEAIEAFAPGKYFAIFMDMRMPVMDGLAATKRIRELESGSRVPIIALTANAMPGDRERCLADGMDDYLSKPFKREELAAKLPPRHRRIF